MSDPIEATDLGRLFDQHAAALELYASQWANCADDCVQEAFIKLATQTVCPDSPVAWLYRVVRNQALNASRSATRRTSHERLATMLTHGLQQFDHLRNDFEELQIRLKTLPTEDRELIVLRIWSGMGWEAIANLTETSSSTAHRRYVAALEKLKKLLEPSCQKNMNYHEN